VKVEKNVGAMAQESCESEQNSLSYEFFEKMHSGAWLGATSASPAAEHVFLKKS